MGTGGNKTTVGTGACLLSFPIMFLAWLLASGRMGAADPLVQAPNVAAVVLFAAALATAIRLRGGDAGAERRGAVQGCAADLVFLGTSALVGSVIGGACAGRGLLGA